MNRITLFDIQRVVSAQHEISLHDLLRCSSKRKFARPRQEVMYLARKLTALSLPQIGSRLGNKNHATVIHGMRVTERYINSDSETGTRLWRAIEILNDPVSREKIATAHSVAAGLCGFFALLRNYQAPTWPDGPFSRSKLRYDKKVAQKPKPKARAIPKPLPIHQPQKYTPSTFIRPLTLERMMGGRA